MPTFEMYAFLVVEHGRIVFFSSFDIGVVERGLPLKQKS